MAIPITAGLKILLSERLQARDAADTDAAAPGDGQIAAPDSLAPPPHPTLGHATAHEPSQHPHDPARRPADDPTPAQGAP